ncbi:MAG TPA: hypothetical protein O0X70_07510 [Methanocorpusculum sp.]|nr:hypothetical protein [Methanocorpusculum sp.]
MAIEQTSINMSGKWDLNTALTMSKLKSELSAYMSDSTMGLAKKEKKKIELKCPFYFYDAYGNETGKITVTVTGCEAYLDSMSLVTTDATLVKYMTGEETGGEGAKDENEAVWTANISCELAGDTFQVIFHRENLVIQNYSNNTTKTTLETYFATRPNLAQKVTA